jgi:hypothetical protein
MNETRVAKKMFENKPKRRRKVGRPKLIWMEGAKNGYKRAESEKGETKGK